MDSIAMFKKSLNSTSLKMLYEAQQRLRRTQGRICRNSAVKANMKVKMVRISKGWRNAGIGYGLQKISARMQKKTFEPNYPEYGNLVKIVAFKLPRGAGCGTFGCPPGELTICFRIDNRRHCGKSKKTQHRRSPR